MADFAGVRILSAPYWNSHLGEVFDRATRPMRKLAPHTVAVLVAVTGAILDLEPADAQIANCEAQRENMLKTLNDAERQRLITRTDEIVKSIKNINEGYRSCRRNNSVVEVARSGDGKRLQELIKAGADVNEKDAGGVTALIYSVEGSNLDLDAVKALIDARADPNAKDKDGSTALMAASGFENQGHMEAIKLLLEAKADVNAKNNRGETALMYASCGDGWRHIVELLVQAGADVNAADNAGGTAFKCATNNSRTAIVAILKTAGAK